VKVETEESSTSITSSFLRLGFSLSRSHSRSFSRSFSLSFVFDFSFSFVSSPLVVFSLLDCVFKRVVCAGCFCRIGMRASARSLSSMTRMWPRAERRRTSVTTGGGDEEEEEEEDEDEDEDDCGEDGIRPFPLDTDWKNRARLGSSFKLRASKTNSPSSSADSEPGSNDMTENWAAVGTTTKPNKNANEKKEI